MLCIVIKGPSFEEAHRQIDQALDYADLVELRLDGFLNLDIAALEILRSHFSIPMIFTLRSRSQGGNYTESEEKRLSMIQHLLELKPEYIDLENHIPAAVIAQISLQYPEVKLILSYHDFIDTPEDLEALYWEMKKSPASFYKIAVTAKNSLDTLRLMDFAKKADHKLIAISMGPFGQISRILAPVIGSPITYASLMDDQQTAPGQLSGKLLVERYHHYSLNRYSAVYGLIGDPVDRSISDETHNSLIKASVLDAVYVKVQIKETELAEFLQYSKEIPFRGLSVTMPLKERVLPLLDIIDPTAAAIGAVNTICFENGKLFGFNTDGIGALNAIEHECQVAGKRIVLIGAGGAAKAVAYEAVRRGALVTILNRTEEKAIQIAQRIPCIPKGLDQMAACAKAGYDILINCTPDPLPISADHILPGTIVMDLTTKPKETLFLKHAKDKRCRIIYGYQMFVEQAIGQFDLWFRGCLDEDEMRDHFEEVISHL